MHSANMGVFDEAVWEGHAVAAEAPPRTIAEAQATFVRGMLDLPTLRDTRNPAELVLSLVIHIVIVGVVILAPLLFTQVLDVHSFEAVFLVAPRPPAAPPPPAAQPLKVARPMARVLDLNKLTAPAVIPAKIKIVADQAPDLGAGVSGVVGGVAGGVLGGIIGGVTDNVRTIPPPPPPERKIVRVGGDVKPPVPISTPEPDYPAVAKAAHARALSSSTRLSTRRATSCRRGRWKGPRCSSARRSMRFQGGSPADILERAGGFDQDAYTGDVPPALISALVGRRRTG